MKKAIRMQGKYRTSSPNKEKSKNHFLIIKGGEDNDLDILLNTTSRLMDPAIFEKAIRGYLLSFTRYQ